jgi:hypothetical protein
MKVQLEAEEVHEIFGLICGRLLEEAALAEADRAALRRWRGEKMRPGSEGMRELLAKVNAELERALEDKRRSAVLKPDWR